MTPSPRFSPPWGWRSPPAAGESTAPPKANGSLRPASLDDANQWRADHAAAVTAAQVQWALRLLGDASPAQWIIAGLLRLQHREASVGQLDQLGRLADPPVSKHTVVEHIRRLIAMADRTVGRDGFLTDLRPAVGSPAP